MTAKASIPASEWLADVEQLSLQESHASFHDVILRIAVGRTGASGGAAWIAGADGSWEVVSQLGIGGGPIDKIAERWVGHRDLLSEVWSTGRSRFVAARLERTLTNEGGNTGVSVPLSLLVAPVHSSDTGRDCLLELFLRRHTEDSTTRELLQAVDEFCRGVVNIRFHTEVDHQRATSETADFARLCCELHGSLDLELAAAAAADHIRHWVGCSRVSILLKRGRRYRVVAVSGLDHFDRRSESVRSLENLVTQRVRIIVVRGADGPHSTHPAHDSPVSSSREDGRPWLIEVTPLPPPWHDGGPVFGALAAEDFDQTVTWTDQRRERFQLAAVQATVAIRNALHHQQLPLRRLGRLLQALGWGSVTSLVFRWAAAAVVLASITAALVFVQTDFNITGRGLLKPAVQRDVFAGVDGIVDEVRAEHGQTVVADAMLLRLRSPQLEQQRAQLEGQLQTTEQEIVDLTALRGGRSRMGEASTWSQNELAARLEELNAVKESLNGQIAALSRHEQELELPSPVSGSILTWEVEQLLEGRPVHAGQRLLTVADLNGPWQLELRVPDRDIGHVLAAQQTAAPLRVMFTTATDLDTRHFGTIVDIGQTVEYDVLDGPVVVVTADVDAEHEFERRPGETVYPQIYCGRRALGYVWFRRLYERLAAWAAL
jgi:multidrug efflux pump subunit AcrA (membrane-fusion protein)